MKPYYERAGITIYHGDCREILPALKGLVITDPPYNIGYNYESWDDSLSWQEYGELLRITCRTPSVVLHYPEDMISRVIPNIAELPAKCVAWTYNAHTPRKWRMLAWFGIQPDFSLASQPYKNPADTRIRAKLDAGSKGGALYDWWHEEQVKNVSEEKTEHPCQIPIEIMTKILRITPSDQVVLDPFMGSGTTLRAAKDLGRRAIGIEIEERYCEIAAKRLSQEVLDFSGGAL